MGCLQVYIQHARVTCLYTSLLLFTDVYHIVYLSMYGSNEEI